MSRQQSGANYVPSVNAPGSIHVIQPMHPVASESHQQPSGVTTYPPSSTVIQCDTGKANIGNSFIVYQNPAGVTGTQSHLTGLQPPAGMASSQTPPGVIQYSVGAANVQTLPGDPENPGNTIPGSTYTSTQSPWNMSFVSLSQFDTKKFINEEMKTLGAIQIIIGLAHIFSGINPILYDLETATGFSGYLFWGGISYIVSGTLSVMAEKDPNTCLLNGSVGMNVVSALLSFAGIIILIVEMSISFYVYIRAFAGGLLPLVLLEFVLTCVVSNFGCQAVCCTHFETLGTNIFSFNPANMTTSHVNTTTSSATPTSSPANPTSSPANSS